MKEEKYTIYAHINKNNNKVYIGQTKQSMSRRFRKDGKGYKKCTNFYKAIQDEGWDNFKHIILFKDLTLEKANLIEIFLIEKFDLRNPEKGYNLAKGGNGFPQIASELISKHNKENWEKGVYDKIKNKVYCIELDKDFESALEAERITNIDNSSIQKVCKHQIKYAGYSPQGEPLHWVFCEDKNENIINELYFKKEIIKGIQIPIFCPELNQIFNSTKEVHDLYNIDPSTIRKAVRGDRKSGGKHPQTKEPLHWIERRDLIQAKGKLSQELWDFLINN